MRSKLDSKQISEYLSKLFIEKIVVSNGWKYRTQEKDNDIDGEIEVFTNEGETTAKLIKVQLKATTELKYNEDTNSIVFDCPIKFLNFCDVCDFPVLLVIYSVTEEKAFWIWTQKYIFQELDSNGVDWRKNTSTIRLKIPIHNEVKEDVSFYDAIKSISEVGVSELQQWKKQESSEFYFTILEEKDNSTNTKRRISAKIYVERSFASSKDSLVELIKKINGKVKNNNYFKKVLDENSDASHPEYVWLYFYDDLIQYEFGLPICRSEWINNIDKNDPVLLKEFDHYIESHDIRIKWEDDYRPLHKYLILNATSKNDYMKEIKGLLTFTQHELANLTFLFNKVDKGDFIEHIISKRKDYRTNFLLISDILPPYECRKLNRTLIDALTDMDNLAIAIKQEQGNEYYLHSQFLKRFPDHLAIIQYELEKII